MAADITGRDAGADYFQFDEGAEEEENGVVIVHATKC